MGAHVKSPIVGDLLKVPAGIRCSEMTSAYHHLMRCSQTGNTAFAPYLSRPGTARNMEFTQKVNLSLHEV